MLVLKDGPGEGTYQGARAPLFLRAVVHADGKTDVLDQPGDAPADDETVHVYELMGSPGVALLCGRGVSRTVITAEYRYRADVVANLLRESIPWQTWAVCEAREQGRDVDAAGVIQG